MAVLKMQKISICALKKDRKAILEQLQHLGVLEVDRDKEEDAFFQKMDTTGQRMKFEKAATAADQALGILDAYAPEKKSLLSSLEGKELIDRELEEKVQTSGPDLIKTARRIYDLDREYAELKAGIAKIENQIESLMPWMALDGPLQEGKTKRTDFLIVRKNAGKPAVTAGAVHADGDMVLNMPCNFSHFFIQFFFHFQDLQKTVYISLTGIGKPDGKRRTVK